MHYQTDFASKDEIASSPRPFCESGDAPRNDDLSSASQSRFFYMAKTRSQKKEVIAKLKDNLGNSKSVVFANFSKITIADLEDLRNKLREQKVEYFICKKTLLRLALAEENLKIDLDLEDLSGNLSVAFSLEDEVLPAKILAEFAKKHKDDFVLLGGVLENKFIAQAKVQELSQLPSKPELIAKTAAAIRAPLSGLVCVMQGNLRGFVGVLRAIGEEKK